MSGCALTVAGIWRNAGVKHPILDNPYVIGTAVSRLITIAKESDAWVPYSSGVFPKAGDAVLIGDNAEGGYEHMYTITKVNDLGDYSTVDGGQPGVLAKTHTWNGRKDGSRVVQGFIDITKLPYKEYA
jgi:hypothetical protein